MERKKRNSPTKSTMIHSTSEKSKASAYGGGRDPHLDWQSSKRNLKESFKFIFNNERYADVHFIVGHGQQKQRVPAHTLVLSVRSVVFATMFSNNWSSATSDVEVPDVEVAAFLDLLRFLYYEHVGLTAENFTSILYAAKKYSVCALEDHCVNYLTRNLCPANAFTILNLAKLFNESKLIESCFEIIDYGTIEAVKDRGFLKIDLNTLCSVLKRDSLSIAEFDLFQATIRWSRAQCRRENLPVNSKNHLSMLKEALYLIRFPLMSAEEFSSEEVAESGLLSDKEIASTMLYIVREKKPKICFNKTPRSGLGFELVVNRFPTLSVSSCPGGHQESIEFITDHDVQLTGIGLYGSPQGATSYDIFLVLYDSNNRSTLYQKSQKCDYSGPNEIFRILLDSSIKLTASNIYQIRLSFQGPKSFCGTGGLENVFVKLPCNQNLKVTFKPSCGNSRHTNVAMGQIPELLFKL